MRMQYLVSVYEVTSPEKIDTKIKKIGSVVCFLGHILWDNVEAQNFTFSAYTVCEWMSFRLATVMSSNPFNFVNAHYYEWVSGVKNAHC